jgi:hypothetical protein
MGTHFLKNKKFEFFENGHPFLKKKKLVPIFQKSGAFFLIVFVILNVF